MIHKRFELLEKYGSLAILLPSALVLAGWFTKNVTLVQAIPSLNSAMQFNTALCFFMLGLALLFLQNGKTFPQIMCTFVSFLIAVLTLAEYILNRDLGIDELVFKNFVPADPVHPGRISIGASTAFLLLSIALFFARKESMQSNIMHFLVYALTCIVFSIGIVTVTGYIFHINSAINWGFSNRIAPHTALLFIITSGYFMLLIKNSRIQMKLALLIVPAMLLLTYALWLETKQKELNFVKIYTQKEAAATIQNVTRHINGHMLALRRMSLAWEEMEDPPDSVWKNIAARYVQDQPGLRLIEWIDTDFRVRWLTPLEGNEMVQNMYVPFDFLRRFILEYAKPKGSAVLSPPFKLVQGVSGFIAYIPLYPNNKFQGYIAGVFDVTTLLEIASPDREKKYFNFVLMMDDHTLHRDQDMHKESQTYRKVTWGTSRYTKTFNRRWHVTVWPTEHFVESQKSSLPEIILGSGILLSLLAAAAFYYAAKSHKRSLQIEEHETRLRTTVNSIVDGLITIDQNGIIQSFNPSCEKIFDYKEKDMIGQNVKVLMPPPYQAEHDQYLKNYKTTGVKKIIGIGRQVQGKRADGSTFPIDLAVSEFYANGQRYFTGVIRDITEQQAAQKAIDEAHAFQELILNQIPDCVYVKDRNSNIILANKTFLEMYPQKIRNKLIGHDMSNLLPRAEYEKVIQNDLETFEKGYIDTTETVSFPNKPRMIFSTKKIRFEDAAGNVFLLGISRDITEMAEAEQEIIRSNLELERFAYIASHDLQEPLRMVSNFTGLLREEYGKELDETAQYYMRYIEDGSARMQNLVSDLLEYSRINPDDTGREDVDCNKTLAVALQNLETLIEETHAVITYDTLPVIKANSVRFTRLMQNLVGNAIKYRRHDTAPTIHIAVEDKDNEWLFSVSDNGIGIREEYLEQIFVIFKRLHNKDEYGGTGIGLAICRKIVESFDGHIWAKSKFGEGTTFHFTIPKTSRQEHEV